MEAAQPLTFTSTRVNPRTGPLGLAWQGDASIAPGRVEVGWRALAEAGMSGSASGERSEKAECYRGKGALWLTQDDYRPAVQGQRPSAAGAAKAEDYFP